MSISQIIQPFCHDITFDLIFLQLYFWKMTQKHLFLKNGLIIGEMDKRYDEFNHILWRKTTLYLEYPGWLGRFEFCTHKCQNETVWTGTEWVNSERIRKYPLIWNFDAPFNLWNFSNWARIESLFHAINQQNSKRDEH